MDKPWLKFYDKGVPHSIEIPKITLAELWNEAVQKNPQGVAVTYFGKKLTYQQMNHYTNQLVKGLARLGVKQGERVAIILPNIPQYVMAHFAALKLGAILVPTNPLYVERELKYQLNDSEVKIAIVLDLVLPRLLKIKDQTSLKDIIVTGVHDFLPTWLKFLYPLKAKKEGKWVKVSRRPHLHLLKDILSEDFPNNLPTPDVKHEDIAMFLYTGGTTGISKGAILTHRNLVSNALQIRSWYTDLHENNEVILCALPFFHSYGLTSCLHFAVILKSN
ncbi:MAG: long-chain fatty acid--CoA ligase, partial [Calditrichaeota bacterium]